MNQEYIILRTIDYFELSIYIQVAEERSRPLNNSENMQEIKIIKFYKSRVLSGVLHSIINVTLNSVVHKDHLEILKWYPHFLLDILVAHLKSFLKHYNKMFFY